MGDFQAAESNHQAVRLQPTASNHCYLALFLMSMQRYDAAHPELDRGPTRTPAQDLYRIANGEHLLELMQASNVADPMDSHRSIHTVSTPSSSFRTLERQGGLFGISHPVSRKNGESRVGHPGSARTGTENDQNLIGIASSPGLWLHQLYAR